MTAVAYVLSLGIIARQKGRAIWTMEGAPQRRARAVLSQRALGERLPQKEFSFYSEKHVPSTEFPRLVQPRFERGH